jgi:hypothetical protein
VYAPRPFVLVKISTMIPNWLPWNSIGKWHTRRLAVIDIRVYHFILEKLCHRCSGQRPALASTLDRFCNRCSVTRARSSIRYLLPVRHIKQVSRRDARARRQPR